MALKECSQTKCSFHKSKGENLALLCPICEECDAPPQYVEDDTCVNCFNCLKDEGFLRSGVPDINRIDERLKKKNKEEKLIEVEAR